MKLSYSVCIPADLTIAFRCLEHAEHFSVDLSLPLCFALTVALTDTNPSTGTTIHSLAAKRAVVELEEGRGWLSQAKDASNASVKTTRSEKEYNRLVEMEAVRLGVEYQITGKYTSSVAVESNSASNDEKKPIEMDITISSPPEIPEEPSGASFQSFTGPAKPAPSGGLFGAVRCRSGGLGGGGTKLFGNISYPASPWADASHTPQELNRADFCELAALNSTLASAPAPPSSSAAASYDAFGGGMAPMKSNKKKKKKKKISTADQPAVASFSSFGRSPSLGEMAMSEPVYDGSDEDMGFGDIDFEIDEDSKTSTTAKSTDRLQRLIALQSFAGYWQFTPDLLAICSPSSSSISTPPPQGIDPKIFATVLALLYLEMKMGGEEEKEAWEMVAEKARGWLDEQLPPPAAQGDGGEGKKAKAKGVKRREELEEKARKMILGN